MFLIHYHRLGYPVYC